MNIIKAYGMSNEDILSSHLIAMGGPTPIQLASLGDGAWSVTGLGLPGWLMKPYTNREVLEMIENSPTVLLKKHLDSEDAYLIKGTLPTVTEEATS